MLLAPFMMAFKGIRSRLTETVNVSSSGLLLKLLDDDVISRRESQFVKVPAQVLRDFSYVGLIFYIVLHAYCFAFVSLPFSQEFIVFCVTTKLLNHCLLLSL